jgi:hypothetical protein
VGGKSASLPWLPPATRPRAPRPPVQHGAPASKPALLAGWVGPVTAPASVQPAPASAAGAVWPGRGRARPSCEDSAVLARTPRHPWLGWWVGPWGASRLPIRASVASSRPPPAVRRCGRDLLPRSRSSAALRYARSAVGPALRSSLRVAGCALSLVSTYGLVGSAGRIAHPASRSRECRPWRAGVLPGVPPAPSMAPGQGPGFERTSPLDSRSGGWVRLRWPAAPTGFVPQPWACWPARRSLLLARLQAWQSGRSQGLRGLPVAASPPSGAAAPPAPGPPLRFRRPGWICAASCLALPGLKIRFSPPLTPPRWGARRARRSLSGCGSLRSLRPGQSPPGGPKI